MREVSRIFIIYFEISKLPAIVLFLYNSLIYNALRCLQLKEKDA